MDDDDDVIVVPPEEPVITEIPDDDDDEHEGNDSPKESEPEPDPKPKKPFEYQDETTGGVYTNVANESDIQILEPAISFLDLDQIEDEPEDSTAGFEESSQPSLPVKIKTEPKYEGYEEDEEDAFEVVGTFEEAVASQSDDNSGKSISFNLHKRLSRSPFYFHPVV